VRFQTIVGIPARNALVAIPCPIAPIPRTATGSWAAAIGVPLLPDGRAAAACGEHRAARPGAPRRTTRECRRAV